MVRIFLVQRRDRVQSLAEDGGVPTSSQSTPALTAISAVGSASAMVWRSSDS
jgi:hypothetical protein